MSPCHNLEPSLVARDSSRLLSVKPNEWMHLSPFYTRMHGEWLRYAKSTSQFHWRFLLVRDVRGFQVNPLCRHDITSPFPPSGNGGYVRNLDVTYGNPCSLMEGTKTLFPVCHNFDLILSGLRLLLLFDSSKQNEWADATRSGYRFRCPDSISIGKFSIRFNSRYFYNIQWI